MHVQIGGLHTEPDTNHVWRFVRYSLLSQVVLDAVVEVGSVAWEGRPSDDRDVFLLVKQYFYTVVFFFRRDLFSSSHIQKQANFEHMI